MTRRIALVLEYEGTAYAGFQRQRDAPTVQAAVEDAVRSLTGEDARVKAAGRTDSGVHATGQVVAFDTASPHTEETFRRGLDHHLPNDISVRGAYEVPPGFDPRRHAIARRYRYTLLNRPGRSPLRRRFTCPEGRSLDIQAMARCLAYLEGERDFAPFSGRMNRGKSTVRRLYRTAVWRQGDEVCLELEGNAFLPQQVRRIGGAVLRVGLGALTPQAFVELADRGQQGAAHWVLPARGLCLQAVKYRTFPPRSHEGTTAHATYAARAV